MTAKSMQILDYVIFGDFIRDCANMAPAARPQTLKDLLAELDKRASGQKVIELSGYGAGEKVVYKELPAQDAEFFILLPNPADLAIATPADYKLPVFYEDLAYHAPQQTAPSDVEKLRSARIADYSTGKCM